MSSTAEITLQTTDECGLRHRASRQAARHVHVRARRGHAEPGRQETAEHQPHARHCVTLPAPDTGKYEGESGVLGGMCVASGDNAASGLQEVTNFAQGSSLSFVKVRAGTAIDFRYCTMNNPGKLALYINDVKSQDVTFPSTGSWSGTYATITVNVAVPQGATLKLQYDAGGSGANIDFIQVR